MDQQFVHYLQHPDLENFLSLRNALLAHPAFNPYSRELYRVDQLLKDQKAADAEEVLRTSMTPNHLISPAAHLKLSLAYQQMGREEEAQRERAIGMRCLEGILYTGDGSRENPFLVTRTSDEYDVVLAQKHQFAQQSLIREGPRYLDRITTTDGSEFYFDVTEIFQIAKGRLSQS